MHNHVRHHSTRAWHAHGLRPKGKRQFKTVSQLFLILMIPSGSYTWIYYKTREGIWLLKSVISSASLEANITAFTESSDYQFLEWLFISRLMSTSHSSLNIQHLHSYFPRPFHSALRRFASEAAARSAVALWRWIINHWFPSAVWRLPVQRTHCHSHAHVPLPQGVYVTFSDARLDFWRTNTIYLDSVFWGTFIFACSASRYDSSLILSPFFRFSSFFLVVPSYVLVNGCCGSCVHPGGSWTLQRGRGGGIFHHHTTVLLVSHYG